MNNAEAKAIIDSMDFDELVNFINDTIDTNMFPLGEIRPLDDEDWWDNIAKRIGALQLVKVAEYCPIKPDAEYFFYDDEQESLEYFRTKEDMVNLFGIDNIIDNYLESLDW